METNEVDLLVINGENAAGGFGITPSIAEELFDMGAHVSPLATTSGTRRSLRVHDRPRGLARARTARASAANYAVGTPGFGVYEANCPPASRMRAQPARPRLYVQLRRPLPHGHGDAVEDHSQGYPARLPRRGHVGKSRHRMVPRRTCHRRARHAPTFLPPTSACCTRAPPTRPTSA